MATIPKPTKSTLPSLLAWSVMDSLPSHNFLNSKFDFNEVFSIDVQYREC